MFPIVPLLAAVLASTSPTAVTHHQAAAHPMRYHVSLPAGWTPGHTWPVVVVIADAHRDFAENLERFAAARGARPWILVAPEVLTCGGTRDQASPPYAYTDADWRAARAVPDHDFDDAGLAAVIAEVHQKWGGEERPYLTGWEAGGHTVWAQALRRPERWRAVAPVSTNYAGRGITEATFARGPGRAALPIQPFLCGAPTGEYAAALPILRQQTERARTEARSHGFQPAPIRDLPGMDHGPMPEAVLAWFDSVRTQPH